MPGWVDPDTYGWVRTPATEAEWKAAISEIDGGPGLERVVLTARNAGCITMVVELRYVDADYRSEFSAFWSKQFEPPTSFARRVHFFSVAITDDQLHELPPNSGYLGYCVVRPIPHPQGRVGRTVVSGAALPGKGYLTLIEDEVSLFGNRLFVKGVPFQEQDAEFLRCAHVALWVCHYAASRRDLVARKLTAELVTHVPKLLSADRALPSHGLNEHQMQAVLEAAGQPALLYVLENLPTVLGVEEPTPVSDPNHTSKNLPRGLWDTRIFSIVCRYLNSGFPVLVLNKDHAIVLVGWYEDPADGQIRFLACDDNLHPYEVVQSPFTDHRAPWLALMVPLPPKVAMSGERAENCGYFDLQLAGANPHTPTSWSALSTALTASPKGVSLRTFLRASTDYKTVVAQQGRDRAAVRQLRLGRFPRHVWVVEAQDRDLRDAGKPCVLAELVYDPHSSDHPHRQPRRVSISLPGATFVMAPDNGKTNQVLHADSAWRSHLEFELTPPLHS